MANLHGPVLSREPFWPTGLAGPVTRLLQQHIGHPSPAGLSDLAAWLALLAKEVDLAINLGHNLYILSKLTCPVEVGFNSADRKQLAKIQLAKCCCKNVHC